MRNKMIGLFFGTTLVLILLLYISYVYLNQQFIWVAGILFVGGTIFNWFLYRRCLTTKK
ncbi:hypothetical protein MCOL2_04431 [Listeria fleischmannii FSL S10-1203]|uniref:Uncharacterized protein n=1 Tax=Listeria fleischmannii FSL S10-1203 TaxID=1265822 RepID=W7DVF5_9LIST|nr:hypothetical protein MCOL2_04431 [Listeria fleischmannii FSL S10-1203]